MKNKKLIEIPNLADITFAQAKGLAKTTSILTNEDISEATGIPIETVRRYFKDPTYNPSPSKIPLLCRVLGNTIMIEWQAVHAGGNFVLGLTNIPSSNLEICIANLTQEFADVIRTDGKAKLDGVYKTNEYSNLENHLIHLEKRLLEMKQLVNKKKQEAMRREHGQNR